MSALGRELPGVGQVVVEHLPQPQRVGPDQAQLIVDLDVHRQRLVGEAAGHHVHHLARHLGDVGPVGMQLQPDRLQPRQVQDVVDQVQQVPAAGQDVARVVAHPLRRQRGRAVRHQLREADHRVQRRAQLVRHVGQQPSLVAADLQDALVLQFQLRAAQAQGLRPHAHARLAAAGLGIVDRAHQRARPHVLLGQVVLRAGRHAGHRQRVVLHAGEHDDGRVARLRAHRADAFDAGGIGQVQVQQHRRDAVPLQQRHRFGQPRRPHHRARRRGRGLGQQVGDQVGVAVVVLHQQDGQRRAARLPAQVVGQRAHGSFTTVNQKPSIACTMDWKATSPTGLVT